MILWFYARTGLDILRAGQPRTTIRYIYPESTVNIDANAKGIWIIPKENNTPQYDNDIVELLNVAVKDTPVFNHFRFIFVFLLVLCAWIISGIKRCHFGSFRVWISYNRAMCRIYFLSWAMPLSRVGWDEETHLLEVCTGWI